MTQQRQTSRVLPIAALAAAALLAGCAGVPNVPMQAGHAPIGNLGVAQGVSLPEKPFVQMPAQVWGGALGGAIGAALASGSFGPNEYQAWLETKKIDVGAIVHDRFQAALDQSRLAHGEPSDSSLRLQVTFHGIHGSGPFAINDLQPMLEVRAELVGKDGAVVWASKEAFKFASTSDVPAHTFREFDSDPKLLADDYAKLADMIAKVLLDRLAQDSKA